MIEQLGLHERFPTKLVDELLFLPEQLKEQESKLLATKLKQDTLQRSIDLWEFRELKKISEEVDDSGKKAHSNEALRKAVLEQRKEQSDDVKPMLDELRKAQLLQEEVVIEVKYLERRWRSLRSVIDLLCER